MVIQTYSPESAALIFAARHDYKAFYEEKFAPMDIPEDLRIDEPTNLKIVDPDDYVPEEKKESEEEEEEEDFPWGF